jgi:hypothetical protein
MENKNLSEDTINKIREINKKINDLRHQAESDLTDLIKELEHRRSLGENI